MARDAFLIRLDPKILNAVKRWAGDELRSTNGQIEYLLRRALLDADRLKDEPESNGESNSNKSKPDP